MLKLDHLTVIAPTLAEGVGHIRDCLGLEVPFGTRHHYMGTHNHRLQLGDGIYLEIVALDPDGTPPNRARWFGLDDQEQVRRDWDDGRRLRGWVAAAQSLQTLLATHGSVFGDEVSLPFVRPEFGFSIPDDGTLPMDGAAPSLIDHRNEPTSMAEIPDLGARLVSLTLEHPEPDAVSALYRELSIDRAPAVDLGLRVRYRALIKTPSGLKQLT